jgi:hypothetical protein
MSQIRHAALQRKLDFLDELIDTLHREKQAARDDDLMGDIEEAREVQQMSREAYSRNELQKAWILAERAEWCVFFGREALGKWEELMTELGELLKPNNQP